MPRPTAVIRVANVWGGESDDTAATLDEQQASVLQNLYRHRKVLQRRRGFVEVAEAIEPSLSDAAAQFDGTAKLTVSGAGTAFHPPVNTNLSVIFWFALDELPGADPVEMVNVNAQDVTKDAWFVFVTGGANKRLAMGSCDGSGYDTLEFSAEDLVADKWYMAACYWDNSGGDASYSITLYDTDGSINSVSTAGVFINDDIPQPLKIGHGFGTQLGVEGRIDKLGIWTTPNADPLPDAATLWNGGAGLTGEEVQADENLLENLVAWYDLDEETGETDWADLTGDHPATATGTVVSVPPAGEF